MYFMILLAFTLHITVLNYISLLGAKPDLMMICVVFFGLFAGGGAGLEAGIFAGLLKDLFCLDFIGINTFIFGVSGLIVGTLNTKFFKESKMTQLILVVAFTAFSMILHYSFVSVFSRSLGFGFSDYLINSVFPTSLYTGLVSIPIFAKFTDMYAIRELEHLL